MQKMLEGRPAGFGVLMDYIEITQNTYSSDLKNTPNAEAQIIEIEREMSHLRIVPARDLQLAIDKNGKLLLIDFDGYYHIGLNGAVFGLSSTTGKRSVKNLLNQSEYQYLIDNYGLDGLDWFYIDESGHYFVRLSKMRKMFGLNP